MTTPAETSKGEGDMSDDELILELYDLIEKLVGKRVKSPGQAYELIETMLDFAYEGYMECNHDVKE